MLDIAYFAVIIAAAFYFVRAPRKEFPLLVVTHSVLQYLMALAFWTIDMNPYLASVLLGFIIASAFLLIWARSMDYSRDQQMLRLFISLGQWAVLIILLIFILFKSPYSYQLSSAGEGIMPGTGHPIIHPLIKVCGNLLLFTTHLLLVFNWGLKWKPKESYRDLGPMLLYFCLVVILYLLQAPLRSHPFT